MKISTWGGGEVPPHKNVFFHMCIRGCFLVSQDNELWFGKKYILMNIKEFLRQLRHLHLNLLQFSSNKTFFDFPKSASKNESEIQSKGDVALCARLKALQRSVQKLNWQKNSGTRNHSKKKKDSINQRKKLEF